MGLSKNQVEAIVTEFLNECFLNVPDGDFAPGEAKVVEKVMGYVTQRFSRMKYILGLGIDFVVLAQRLSEWDDSAKAFRQDLDDESLFEHYSLITSRGGRKANTLSFEFNGNQAGIRKTEERVVQLFHALNRTGYPSAYVYNTGQWTKYRELLVLCFQLSEIGRLRACKSLVKFGIDNIAENAFFGRETPRARLLEMVIDAYTRTGADENGGLVFQALAYGYVSADRPFLSLIADKVRTGSARQKRFGDIDCYCGLDLELSVEVKDLKITSGNVERELGGFINEVRSAGILGLAFVGEVDEDIRTRLSGDGISCLTEGELRRVVASWDWPKQNAAIQGMLHYLSHIEQDAEATLRLLRFIKSHDDAHDSLNYLIEGE